MPTINIFGETMPDVESGSFSPQSLAEKRKLAAAMLMQGQDMSPIKSHWQGLARMANAALGGYDLYKIDQDEKGASKAEAAAYSTLLGGTPGAPAPGGTPAATTTPIASASEPGTYLDRLKKFEDFKPKPYSDGKQTSIGYGTRAQPGDVSITPEEAHKRLVVEEGQARQLVQAWAKTNMPNMSPAQEDAMTDLTFNAGAKWMESGLGAALKAGNLPEAQKRYELYINAERQPNATRGLLARRRAMSPLLLNTQPGAPPASADELASAAGGVTGAGSTLEPNAAATGAPAGLPVTQSSVGPQISPPAGGNPAAVTAPAATPANPAPESPMRARIQALLAGNPAEQRVGKALAAKYATDLMAGDKATDEMREYQLAQRQGETRSFTDWKKDIKSASASNTNVNVDQRGETQFAKSAAEKQAKRFDELVESGLSSKQTIADLQTLSDLRSRIKSSGKTAEVKLALGPYAEALGVKIDELGDLQAYNAIIAKMVPNMRVPGSGTTSDFDARMFLQALPALSSNKEGQELVSNTFQALHEAKLAAAEIGSRALAGEITPREAEKQLRAIPNPYQLFKEQHKRAPSELEKKAPAVRKYNRDTGEFE